MLALVAAPTRQFRDGFSAGGCLYSSGPFYFFTDLAAVPRDRSNQSKSIPTPTPHPLPFLDVCVSKSNKGVLVTLHLEYLHPQVHRTRRAHARLRKATKTDARTAVPPPTLYFFVAHPPPASTDRRYIHTTRAPEQSHRLVRRDYNVA